MDLPRLAVRLRELRGDRTAADVARRAGISASMLSGLENADRHPRRAVNPSVPVLRCLADELGASRVELLELAGYHADAGYDRERERLRGKERRRQRERIRALRETIEQLRR